MRAARRQVGEAKNNPLRLKFNRPACASHADRRLKLEFHGAKVTSDAGLLAYRELDEHLGLTATAAEAFNDPRYGKNTQHTIIAFFRLPVPGADRSVDIQPSRRI